MPFLRPARSWLYAWPALFFAFAMLTAPFPALAQPIEPKLAIHPPDARGWVQLNGTNIDTQQLITVLASSNLVHWQTIAVLHAASFGFLDPGAPQFTQRFYRFHAGPLAGTEDWKNQVVRPYDTFTSLNTPELGWIKFAIPIDNPTRVFYADSDRHTFHYDFVTSRLEPFIGISPGAFDAIAHDNDHRELLLGAVLLPGHRRNDCGIQFISRDPLSLETTRDYFELVKSTVVLDTLWRGTLQTYYVPTFEQAASVAANTAFFASNGIPITTPDRWYGRSICYSEGWSVGTLKFFAATEVPAAYADGRLGPNDILLTDGIPAELPYVSGILTFSAATPNSHVVILARSYNVPFAFLVDTAERTRALQLTNRSVVFQSGIDFGDQCSVLLEPNEPPVEPAVLAELAALKNGAGFQLIPKERYGAYTASTENLVPADIRFFGGKAANYGLLRQAIPSNSYPAIAISFDLWDDFMSQALGNGRTLRQEISNRLSGFTYPPNVSALQTQLAGIRSLIRNSTQFTLAQIMTITNALSSFNRQKNIRFRSSTNVEDAESFSGAGLYDSYSGCLPDDQDTDSIGPSVCDPTENEERGVFRAIRRVFASFYNDNAYLERLRLGVDQNAVGMAMLVHHSTPDDIELANGVATGNWHPQAGEFNGTMVTQLGAVSVANPDGSTVPEQVDFDVRANGAINVFLRTSSSLVRLGEAVMEWNDDYRALADLLSKVRQRYSAVVSNKPALTLDIEYKKVAPLPGTLEIKQVREIPTATNRYIAPFILNRPDATLATWHGYYGSIFMAHRLKARWTLQHRTVPFTEAGLRDGFYTDVRIEFLNGTNVQTISGPIDSLPEYSREVSSSGGSPIGVLHDRWMMNMVDGPMHFSLRTFFAAEVTSKSPFRTIPETQFYGLALDVGFSQPRMEMAPLGAVDYVTNTSTTLYALRSPTSNDVYRELTFDIPGQGTNIQIFTSLWLPEEARGDDCRCPVLQMVESRIAGFTTEPILLRGFWSQTFSDIHNQNYQHLIFEPRLEENLSPQQHVELSAANIAQIYLNANGGTPVLQIVGLDGELRQFSDAVFGGN